MRYFIDNTRDQSSTNRSEIEAVQKTDLLHARYSPSHNQISNILPGSELYFATFIFSTQTEFRTFDILQPMTRSNVIFRNQPKLSEYEIQKDFNDRRLGLVALVDNFLSHHHLFKTDTVNVTFSDKGLGSLICILETKNGKMVLKVPLSKTSSGSEGLFLKTWEKVGVKVPHIIEEGELNDYRYILMEYIDAPLLSEVLISNKGASSEIGHILRTMHIPKAKGYGRVVDGKAEYSTFEEWIGSKKIQDAVNYVQKNKLLEIEPLFTEKAFSILTEHANKNQSSYCHFDFGNSNIFATKPLTIFDPNPQFNNGYLDLGLSVFNIISAGASPQRLIESYFGKEVCDEKVLYASILLNSYIKLPSRHNKGKLDHIRTIQEYLTQNKHLLEK